LPEDDLPMALLNFENQSLWINIAIFVAAAGVVWFAGTRLSEYLAAISDRTGIGKAFTGMLLLGGITSLPEVATVTTASATGNAALAVNNVLGSAAMNVVILALADAMIGRDALTSVVAHPIVLLQGALDILLLSIVACAIIAGDMLIVGVGGWTSVLLLLFLLAMWASSRYQNRRPWVADGSRDRRQDGERLQREKHQTGRTDRKHDDGGDRRPSGTISLKGTIAKTIIAGLAILVAGFLLARTGDALAQQTGLGSSFVGAVLVGIATSLPEISSVTSAVRLKQYEMAIGDIFGTNLFNVGLIFLADAVYAGGPVLNEVGRFSSFATLLGIVLTTTYLAGLIERKGKTVVRMGIDSIAVLGIYSGGLVILYTLR
jgi:cation:H+ antiporter